MIKVLLILMLCLSSCAKITLVNDRPRLKPTNQRKFTAFEHRPFFFTMQNQCVEISKFCKGNWKSFTASRPFYAGFLSGITGGYYSPYSVSIRCAKRK